MLPQTVEDRSIEFVLRHGEDAEVPDLAALMTRPFTKRHWRDAFDEVQADVRTALWACKSALDAIDPDTYTATRNKLFPLAASGAHSSSHQFSNRAGYKLMESMEATGVWMYLTGALPARPSASPSPPSSLSTAPQKKESGGGGARKRRRDVAFADVCGGPGAFSQALFAMSSKYQLRLQGYGMTLGAVDGLDWYPELLRRRRFTATYGLDGTGDIFSLANVECLASVTAPTPLKLVVADGGFHVDFALANYQETISSRILYGQWLAALKLLKSSGCFVLKLFDSFSPLTRAMLYLSTFMYASVHVVKPKHSRVVNSERYLVCLDYQGMPKTASAWMAYLDRCYEEGFTDNDHVPEIIPASWMEKDVRFMADVTAMNATIAANQQTALRMVLEAALAVKAARDAAKEANRETEEAATTKS